jgi:hypothetical protein
MKVTCSQCLTVYNISEDKLKKEVSRTTCRKCGARIEIRRPVGVPSIKPIVKEVERLSPPTSLHDILDQAIPKRILDDERTILDEGRMEQPRPEVNTNLAFGPNPSEEKEYSEMKETSAEFESFPVHTMPSIRASSSESSDSVQEQKEPKYFVEENESQEEDLEFRLDWVVSFCANVLSAIGLGLMLIFQSGERFLWASSVIFFGIMLSILLAFSSRFGLRDGNIIVCALGAIISVLLFHVFYTTVGF